ncbi:hypothetical protein C8K36_12114 [Rhodococcus sp. OK519]|nr:hypothetical protein C8K36_12114 [Rhodococcus sp. OK519]
MVCRYVQPGNGLLGWTSSGGQRPLRSTTRCESERGRGPPSLPHHEPSTQRITVSSEKCVCSTTAFVACLATGERCWTECGQADRSVLVVIGISAANRGERAFDSADEFRGDRFPNEHLGIRMGHRPISARTWLSPVRTVSLWTSWSMHRRPVIRASTCVRCPPSLGARFDETDPASVTRARDVDECAGRFAERREGRARAIAASAITLLHAAMVQCTPISEHPGQRGVGLSRWCPPRAWCR